MGESVPPVLLSGHHGNIDKWRREQSILRTAKKRPDLLKNAELTQKEKNWLREQLIKKNKKAVSCKMNAKGKNPDAFS